jgi:hypothetical protein
MFSMVRLRKALYGVRFDELPGGPARPLSRNANSGLIQVSLLTLGGSNGKRSLQAARNRISRLRAKAMHDWYYS